MWPVDGMSSEEKTKAVANYPMGAVGRGSQRLLRDPLWKDEKQWTKDENEEILIRNQKKKKIKGRKLNLH